VNTRVYLWLARGTDVLHLLFGVGVLILGRLWIPLPLFSLILAVTICSQIVTLGCPMVLLSSYFRRKYDPSCPRGGSLTWWLYRRFGRWVAIPITVVLVGIASAIAIVL
jgi:hypothetical protein